MSASSSSEGKGHDGGGDHDLEEEAHMPVGFGVPNFPELCPPAPAKCQILHRSLLGWSRRVTWDENQMPIYNSIRPKFQVSN